MYLIPYKLQRAWRAQFREVQKMSWGRTFERDCSIIYRSKSFVKLKYPLNFITYLIYSESNATVFQSSRLANKELLILTEC